MSESQPQIDLPQVSIARYLDLLKRRRWQVVPISLLGLLIGGLVAFFIPRYYVAETRLEHFWAPGEPYRDTSGRKDPFRGLVENARHTIPQTRPVLATMQNLGWSEAMERDPTRRLDNVRAAIGRLRVVDVNPGKDRDYAQILVSYKDQDGERSANFLNQLVQTWVGQRLDEMRAGAEDAIKGANSELRKVFGEYNTINRELGQLATQYGFHREYTASEQREVARMREQQQQGLADQLEQLKLQIAQLKVDIGDKTLELDSTPSLGDASQGELANLFPAGSPQQAVYVKLLSLKNSLKYFMGPAHPDRLATSRQVEQLELQLANLLTGGEPSKNPRIAQFQAQLKNLNAQLKAKELAQTRLEARIKNEADQFNRRTSAYTAFVQKVQLLEEARLKREQAQTTLRRAQNIQRDLALKRPIQIIDEAVIPAAPTEPNIALVAGLGSLIGLGVAIGLILLIDMLQGTLKTVEDAERALPVPVLGGISYLETEEQRTKAATGRRRASIVAAAFLFCGVVVVTVYYVAPDRLPPFARDLLTMVLGD
ncbi:MAG: hypothetical protein VYE77_12290 [Planctomycetota bacterium]|nr:hypothetical protein [Planctomycetota bacterium]